jgi:hypothetical protein
MAFGNVATSKVERDLCVGMVSSVNLLICVSGEKYKKKFWLRGDEDGDDKDKVWNPPTA